MQAALFLDRDGVLIEERGEYNYLPAHFRPIKTALKTLRAVSSMGVPLVVATNQGGIAKQLYTDAEVVAMHERITAYYGRYGIRFLQFYYCPHHHDVALCNCRKPLPGMLLDAAATHGIDLKNSLMIGDTPRDMEAAAAAGAKGILLEANTGWPKIEMQVVRHFQALGRQADEANAK